MTDANESAAPDAEPDAEPEAVFNLAGAFRHLQQTLLISHAGIRTVTKQPGTLGDHAEVDWIMMLRAFLPKRYTVGPIFAVDSRGASSQQIDVAIYDNQYSPLWFGSSNGVQFVPVEAVYAVFEAKPSLTPGYLEYAQEKVASVRGLLRTSAAIKHAGGTYVATDPAEKHIIGGILTAKASWAGYNNSIAKLQEYLPALGGAGSLDIGIALDTISFDYTPMPADGQQDEPEVPLTFSAPEDPLIHFAIRLFHQLQRLGTVLALDMGQYEKALQPDGTAPDGAKIG